MPGKKGQLSRWLARAIGEVGHRCPATWGLTSSWGPPLHASLAGPIPEVIDRRCAPRRSGEPWLADDASEKVRRVGVGYEVQSLYDPERPASGGSVTAARSARPRALHLACPPASWPGHDVLHDIRGREHADDTVRVGYHGQRPDVPLVHHASRFTHVSTRAAGATHDRVSRSMTSATSCPRRERPQRHWRGGRNPPDTHSEACSCPQRQRPPLLP